MKDLNKKSSEIISPSDLKQILADHKKARSSDNKKEEMNKISIFMNVFNVHVNRIPISGKIVWLHGASVGELQSIVPLLEKLNKKIIPFYIDLFGNKTFLRETI